MASEKFKVSERKVRIAYEFEKLILSG